MEDRKFINRVYLQSLLPVSLAVLLVQLCSVINNLAVGKIVGSDGLAVMSVVSPVGFVFATLGSLLAVGGSIQAGHSIGEQDFDSCNRSLYVALKIMIIFGVIFTAAIIIFVNPLMSLLNVPETLRDDTRRYLIAFAPAAFGAMGVYIPFNFLKINGAQKYGVYVSGIMAVVNISLDFIFADLLKMGMAGIGLATTLGYWAATIPGIIILYSKIGGFSVPDTKKEKKFVPKIISSGSPSAVNNLCHLLRSFFMNLIIISALGKTGLSIFSIISTVFLFSVAITNGTSLSMAPFAAVFYSEKDNTSLRQVFAAATVSAIILMCIFVAILGLIPDKICALFSITDPELVRGASQAIRIFAVSLVVSSVNTIFTTFYQSIKHTVFANILTVFRSFAFVVIFAFIIAKVGKPGKLWYGFLIAEVLTLLLTFVFALIYSKKHKKSSNVLLIDTSAEESGRYLALSVDKDPAHISDISAKISDFCEQNELSPKLSMAINLAVEEIIVSFNEHALQNERDSIRTNVRILIFSGGVILRFRTGGKKFDPVSYAESDEEKFGDSMGIRMIQKLAEVVMYDRVFGINNLTILF